MPLDGTLAPALPHLPQLPRTGQQLTQSRCQRERRSRLKHSSNLRINNLGPNPGSRDQHRTAASHRFQWRQTKPLGSGGCHAKNRAAVAGTHRVALQIAQKNNPLPQASGLDLVLHGPKIIKVFGLTQPRQHSGKVWKIWQHLNQSINQ